HVVLRRFAFSACQTGIPQTTPREQPTRKEQNIELHWTCGAPSRLRAQRLSAGLGTHCHGLTSSLAVSPMGWRKTARALRIRCLLSSAPPLATVLPPRLSHTGIVERLWRNGMFFAMSSFGMRRFTSYFPCSTRLI